MKNTTRTNHELLSIPSIICKIILDKEKAPIDYELIDSNRSFEDLVGLEKSDLLGRMFSRVQESLNGNTSNLTKVIGDVALTGMSQEIELYSSKQDKWFKIIVTRNMNNYITIFFNIKVNNEGLENELKKANYINQLLLDSLPHPALLVRKDRTVIAINKVARDQGAMVGGLCWRDWGHSLYINPEDIERANSYTPGESEIIRCHFCKGCESLEINDFTNVQTKLGDIYWDIFWVPTQEEGIYLHYAIDITEVKKREEEIKYLNYHDGLTGLYNRLYLEERLEDIGNYKKSPTSIIMGDINGLKLTNDVFGHFEGDKLLKRVANVLRNSCRQEDIIARYGGDEFAILLPNTSYAEAVKVCEKVRKNYDDSYKDHIPTSISIGCATMENTDENIYQTLKTAEDRMYRHKLLESKSTRNSILTSLETSLHEKDIETKEHASRIVKTTDAMGKLLGLNTSEMDELNLFARLHDIGKITVDERILNKKEKLTDDEFEEIKKHSEAGYRIAKSSQDLQNIADYILSHHERWDGKGYPQGLKGEEIPLLARILTIADAYDAMTNDRPYRKSMSRELAIQELKNCSGKQFDPSLVPLFIKILQV